MTPSRIQMADIHVDQETRDAVLGVLDSGKYIKGPASRAFETEFAAHHGARHGVAVSNGTTALHLAYYALGVGAGDEVLVPSHTYLASATPAVHLGAKPIWVEVDPDTMTMDPDDVRSKVTDRTKAITAVHLYGHPADMAPLQEIASDHGLRLIADAAQAHDAAYNGRPIGAVGADVSTFSFYPSKNMTLCGDGGMILTDDLELAERMAMLRDHGRRPDKKYENDLLGFNFRLSDLLAAIGSVQLRHLRAWTNRRREVAARYVEVLEGLPGVEAPDEASWARHVYHQFVVRTDQRDALAAHLDKLGISTGLHYPVPTHLQPCMRDRFDPPSMPFTESLVDRILSLPVHQGMTDEGVDRVLAALRSFEGNHR